MLFSVEDERGRKVQDVLPSTVADDLTEEHDEGGYEVCLHQQTLTA